MEEVTTLPLNNMESITSNSKRNLKSFQIWKEPIPEKSKVKISLDCPLLRGWVDCPGAFVASGCKTNYDE
jgi:hypothetical protein